MKRKKHTGGTRRAKPKPRPHADPSKSAGERPRFSGRRKCLFGVAALSLPFLLLGLLEVGLRLGGYGYDTAFFRTERETSGQTFLVYNESFINRFFQPELARWPVTFKLDADKPADAQRIFIFGESAAMGDPRPSVGPSCILDVLLREKLPGQKFEVVNLGITAVNSHVILPIARDVAARGKGDIWLIYMGNNEMVGPFGAASVFGSRGTPLPLVRLNLALQRTRFGQLGKSLQRRLRGGSRRASWGGMGMFLENQVPPDDPRRKTVYLNFARNLRDIVEVGAGSGAKIVLCTVSVNLRDCPPFGSLLNRDLPAVDRSRFDTLYAGVQALQTNRQPGTAAMAFEQAALLDPNFAELQYRWGQCLLMESNALAARKHFQLAIDVDTLPFRADSHINRAIRSLGEEQDRANLAFCDAEAALASAAADGIPGDESFFDHVHFNFDGNYRLARVWAEEIVRLLPDKFSNTATSGWVPQEFCEKAIGLSDWNRISVISSVLARMAQPPLNTQFNNASRWKLVQDEINVIQARQRRTNAVGQARAEFESALAQAPQDPALSANYGEFLEAVGDRPAALSEFLKIMRWFPHDFQSGLQAGRLLSKLGNLTEAERLLRRAAAQRPSWPDPWFDLGGVLGAQAKYAEALECFETVLRMQPSDVTCLIYKARMLSKLDRRAEAVQVYREAIKLEHDNWQAHLELAGELVVANEASEAIQAYLEAVRLNPRHPVMRVNLGVILARQNRLDEAIQQFESALSLDPDNVAASDYLRQVRARRDQAGD